MNPIISEALFASLTLSLIPMAAISLCAGLVAMLQSITQVQEQSIVHLARIAALVGVLLWGGHQGYQELEGIFIKILAIAAK
jgi:flagellar biosynthesis protein FliQ